MLDELSFFTINAPINPITATAVSASGCYRGFATFEVSSYEHQTPTDEHGATSDQTVHYTVGDQAGLCSATAIGLPENLDLGVANSGQVTADAREHDPWPDRALVVVLSVNTLEVHHHGTR